MTNFMRIFLLAMVMVLSACGFHLRGQVVMPFESLYLETANSESALVKELRRNLEINKVRLANSAEEADVVLHIRSEEPEKQILTLGGTGRVTEFKLRYRVTLRAYDKQQQEWVPNEEILLQRDYLYGDTQILAKGAEEALLIRSLRGEMARRIVRRLSRAHPVPQ